jgi:hypothetical protein
MFMPSGGRVLEMRHPHDDVFVDCFRPLAEVMGHAYQAQICAPVQDAHGREVNYSDLMIDLDVLRENLKALDA